MRVTSCPSTPPPFLPQQFNYEFILVSGGFVMKMTGAGASTCHLSSGTALRCRRPALRFRIASMPVALSPWSHLSQVRWQVDWFRCSGGIGWSLLVVVQVTRGRGTLPASSHLCIGWSGRSCCFTSPSSSGSSSTIDDDCNFVGFGLEGAGRWW